MIVVDGFFYEPDRQLGFLKKCFKLFGWEMPASATTITDTVIEEAKQKEKLMKNEISDLKNKESALAMSLMSIHHWRMRGLCLLTFVNLAEIQSWLKSKPVRKPQI